MLKATCYIIGAGDMTYRKLLPRSGDLLIAADGGYQSLLNKSLRPDLVIGDMDSFLQKVTGIPLIRFPVRKDDTDLSLAMKAGKKRGYHHFKLFGASGGLREDHFVAALQLMGGWLDRGNKIQLIAPNFTIYGIHNGCQLISAKPGRTVSVFSHSKISQGVSLHGLSYEAQNISLCHGLPLGVSNAMGPKGRAVICVKKGTLLIYLAEKDNA